MPMPSRQAKRTRAAQPRGRAAAAASRRRPEPAGGLPSGTPWSPAAARAPRRLPIGEPDADPIARDPVAVRAGDPTATAPRPGPAGRGQQIATAADGLHPLTDREANARLFAYESTVRRAFERIVPVLKEIAKHSCEPDFAARAQAVARSALKLTLPERLLADAWVTGLDMRRLFAWVLFETYRRVSDAFFAGDPPGDPPGGRPAGPKDADFLRFLVGCGFHQMDVTPCADGRLAHALSFVLRLPYEAVRRKSYAGALFDIEHAVERWTETELRRFREGVPNPADAPTRYLKVVLYHLSSADPHHEGCAAHGSNDAQAARAGRERLEAFRQAIENGFCCGASVDLLLVGVDTDTDAIRVHVPDARGHCALDRWLDAQAVYEETRGLAPDRARQRIAEQVRAHAPGEGPGPAEGMTALIARLIENNLSQIDYVRHHHGGRYRDIGHAERFIGAGTGFEEIQLRNLTYFAYLDTVEEGAPDLDVGIRIFRRLNVEHGLPVPVVVRHDYKGGIPGARERAIAHCERTARALAARYPELHAGGLLVCLRVVRDCEAPRAPIEIVGSSLDPDFAAGNAAAH